MQHIIKNGLITNNHGDRFWYKDNKLHRIGGPAVEYINGTKKWYVNGQPHREDGPAIDRANGTKKWFILGKAHRLDGPAFILLDYIEIWYVDGVELDKHPLSRWLKKRRRYSKFKRGDLTECQVLEIKMVFGFWV